MIFKDDAEAISTIKANLAVPDFITKAREKNKMLCALVSGEDFSQELITKIEHIESEKRAIARKKYSRPVTDFFGRLFLPIQNVYSAKGAVKKYKVANKNQLTDLIKQLSNIRDGKSLQKYIESTWTVLVHTDASGILFLEYKTKPDVKAYPTYKGIYSIRSYKPNGQNLEWVLFEPVAVGDKKLWRIVDDVVDRFIWQEGEKFYMNEDELFTVSYKHPFGKVPGVIISNITDKNGNRLTPIEDIIPIATEYARDQSIKSIYKFQNGFPKHWRRYSPCHQCKGAKKLGDQKCTACDGRGEIGNADVTDVARLPMPENGDPVISGNDIMGFSAPDLETWRQYNTELEKLERDAHMAHWGTEINNKIVNTATEAMLDLRPKTNRLNQYADSAEWIEWQFSEWIANFIIRTKKKDESICQIFYGRRFILEGIDSLQKKYDEARKNGSNTVLLDSILDELITVKFENDPDWLRIEQLKVQVEPYVHLSPEQVNTIFGTTEAKKKVFFREWWDGLDDAYKTKSKENLVSDFESKFQEKFGLDNKILKSLSSVSPLVANQILSALTINQTLELIGLPSVTDGDTRVSSVATPPIVSNP